MPATALTVLWPVIAGAITPVDAATGSLVSYILGYGPVGIIALALVWILLKGTFVLSKTADARVAEIRADKDAALAAAAASQAAAVSAARIDLLEERARVLAEKVTVEAQRDAALHLAQDKLIPLLSEFIATTSGLLPLLQSLLADREEARRRRD